MTRQTLTSDAPLPVLDHGAERPTRARYGVLIFLCTLAMVLYIDRVCIGQAAKSIQDELGLTKTQMAWVFNAFTLAYCLFEVPTGHWGDRYGSRGVITRIVIWWSVFTALTGAAWGLWSLIAIRFLFGAGEAGAFPNAARVVPRWFPPDRRGFARGAITFVSLVGGAIAPPLAAYLIRLVGWRWTFAIFGAMGVIWAAAFYYWFRDDPAEHRSVNDAERAVIAAGRAPDDEAAPHAPGEVHASIPWGTVLASRNTWLLSAIMGLSAICMYVQFQWFPTYLKEAKGVGEVASGWMTGAVMGSGAVGCLSGGFIGDWITRRARSREIAARRRRRFGAAALLLAGLSVLAVRGAESAAVVTLCNAFGLFFIQAAIPTWWTVVAEISGRHGAAMWGLMNSVAGLLQLSATFATGWWVDRRQGAGATPVVAWGEIFDGVAVGLGLAAVCWLGVNAMRSIVARVGVPPPATA